MSLKQTMSLGDTPLQLLFRFIVSTLYGVYLPHSCVVIVIIIIIIVVVLTKRFVEMNWLFILLIIH